MLVSIAQSYRVGLRMSLLSAYFLHTLFNNSSSEDAGIEPRNIATLDLAVMRSNHSVISLPLSARSHPHSARSHPQLARSHPHSARSHPHSAWSHPHSARSHPQLARSHPHSARSHPHSARSHPHSARSYSHSIWNQRIRIPFQEVETTAKDGRPSKWSVADSLCVYQLIESRRGGCCDKILTTDEKRVE